MPISEDKIQYQLPLFPDYIIPNGGLTNERASHALFYYYLLATEMKDKEDHGIVYEGDKDPEYFYREVFKSVAKLYNLRPEYMENLWPCVDLTCDMHNLPKLPHGTKYRFQGVVRIQ